MQTRRSAARSADDRLAGDLDGWTLCSRSGMLFSERSTTGLCASRVMSLSISPK